MNLPESLSVVFFLDDTHRTDNEHFQSIHIRVHMNNYKTVE